MTTARRVLIVDDHPVFRDGLHAIIESDPDLTVVGEAATGLEAVDLAARLAPEVILMDLNMPELGGVEATRRILEHAPHTRILVLTMLDDRDAVTAALTVGARGYLLKGSDRAEVLRSVWTVADGDAVLSAEVADRLPLLLNPPPHGRRTFPELTEREDQILRLMALGRDNSQIAAELTLSLKTIRNYASSIFQKLGVPGRSQAIVKARDSGLAERHPQQP